jgi:hypothetical protein
VSTEAAAVTRRQIRLARVSGTLFAAAAVILTEQFAVHLASGALVLAVMNAFAVVLFVASVVLTAARIGTMRRQEQELSRHAGRLELAARVSLELGFARPGTASGSCAHPDAEPVNLFSPSTGKRDGERVAWVCPDCNAELPAGWAPPSKDAAAGGGGGGEYTSETRRAALPPAEARQARQARLAAALCETTIARMEPGRTYYTVPWAMRADTEGRLWLYPGHTADVRRCGAVEMRVERREDGYHVWPAPGRDYAPGAVSGEFIPVAALEGTAGGTGGSGGLGGVTVHYFPAASALSGTGSLTARVEWDDVAYPSKASEHFAALARIGLEHCLSWCPICEERDQGAYAFTPDDLALMRSGAIFGTDAVVTLPSGRKMTGTEISRWIKLDQERCWLETERWDGNGH